MDKKGAVRVTHPIQAPSQRKLSFGSRLRKDLVANRALYLIALPGLLYYIIFHYIPMGGVVLAFQQYRPTGGLFDNPWVGLDNFRAFFNSYYFGRLVRNTFLLSLLGILFTFPLPIALAIMLNELRSRRLKRVIQTVSYMPHFVSTVVICGMVLDFVSENGVVTQIARAFGYSGSNLLMYSEYFRPIYIITDIWQQLGWNSIIYIAAILGVDQELYEAAKIDGAGRFQQILHVTLPGIAPTIVIMLILRMGSLMSVGYEKIILLYNPSIYETADVISSFVYRKGILQADYSYSTAVGLFNSLINFALLIASNSLSRRVSDTSLW